MSGVKRAIRFLWLLAFLTPLSANATRIDLTPTVTTTTVGSAFSVNVVISGLSLGSPALAVSDFDLDISYSPALLLLNTVSFGAGLGSPVIEGSSAAAGVIDIFAISGASYAALRGTQSDTFTLATLNFLALATGTNSLSFVQNVDFIVDLINASGQDPINAADPAHCQSRNCIDVGGARVVIAPRSTVPEPDPWFLLGAAVLASLGVRRISTLTGRQAASAA